MHLRVFSFISSLFFLLSCIYFFQPLCLNCWLWWLWRLYAQIFCYCLFFFLALFSFFCFFLNHLVFFLFFCTGCGISLQLQESQVFQVKIVCMLSFLLNVNHFQVFSCIAKITKRCTILKQKQKDSNCMIQIPCMYILKFTYVVCKC